MGKSYAKRQRNAFTRILRAENAINNWTRALGYVMTRDRDTAIKLIKAQVETARKELELAVEKRDARNTNKGETMAKSLVGVVLMCLLSIGCTQHTDLASPSGLAPVDLDAKAHLQTVSVSVWTPDPANPSQPFYLPNQPVAFQSPSGVVQIDWTYGPRALASVQVPITDPSVVVVVNRQNFCSFSRAFALTGKRSTFSVELQQGCYR